MARVPPTQNWGVPLVLTSLCFLAPCIGSGAPASAQEKDWVRVTKDDRAIKIDKLEAVLPKKDPIAMGSLKADRILFLGNSLTLHGPLPEIRWTGNWGMAASAQDKDYVHLLTAAINARTGGKLIVEPTPVDGKKSAENVLNIAGIFEQGYATYQVTKIQKQLDWKADIVVLQCGENVPAKGFDPDKFHTGLKALSNDLKRSSNPHIFVTSNILWANPVLDDIKRKVCAEDPDRRTFVDISAYRMNIKVNGPVGHPSSAARVYSAAFVGSTIIALCYD